MEYIASFLKKMNDYSKLIGVTIACVYLICIYIQKIQETYPRLDRIEEKVLKLEDRITANDKNLQLVFEKISHLNDNVGNMNKNIDFIRDKIWIIYNNKGK